ncbi:MAG: hypothetical protein AB8B52_08810 [Winogradskyella sp.]|uniref:hypothetical protein n=1 Tax=Winogradskyella sp. TaxID=1883156 RepID=UPI00385CA6A2
MLTFKFLPKFSILVVFIFVLFTIVGTLSHEFGHIAVAKYLGYDTTLDYGSMNYLPKGYNRDENVLALERITKDYKTIAYDKWPDDLKFKFEALQKTINATYFNNEAFKTDSFWITIGGPAQTLLTSFLGLLVLFIRRRKWTTKFETIDWLTVFMALFALREVFNFVQAFFATIVNSESNFHADEFRISRYLGYHEWVIPTFTMILGLVISSYVMLKIIPLKFRFTFIISGFIGGILGFVLWFGFLGELLFRF